MFRFAVVCLLALFCGPTAARAALPAANPPNEKELARKGVHVEWPLSRSVSLRPIHLLSVPVRSRQPVSVSLEEVDARGRHVATLKRRTLRNGTFSAMVIAKQPRLALRMEVAGKRYWSWIRVSRDEPVGCENGAIGLPDVAFGSTTLRSGSRFTYRFRNDARCPAAAVVQRYPFDPHWSRLTASGWKGVRVDSTNTAFPEDVAQLSTSYIPWMDLLGPGNERAYEFTVPHGLPAGRYRVQITRRGVLREGESVVDRDVLFEEVDVIP